MHRICAWCNQDLGKVQDSEEIITHSMCTSCARSLLSGSKIHLQTFLNMLDMPVLLVDDQGIVQTANVTAQRMLNKELDHIEGFRGGDVMECTYAKQPGGCGNTEHCKACTIRNTIMQTHETGESIINQIAYQDIDTPEGTKRMRFHISTEKVDNIVFLRIDDVEEASTNSL